MKYVSITCLRFVDKPLIAFASGQHVEQRHKCVVATAFLSRYRCTSISQWHDCHDLCICHYSGRDMAGVVFGETGVEVEAASRRELTLGKKFVTR
jgi:hypothetical protein